MIDAIHNHTKPVLVDALPLSTLLSESLYARLLFVDIDGPSGRMLVGHGASELPPYVVFNAGMISAKDIPLVNTWLEELSSHGYAHRSSGDVVYIWDASNCETKPASLPLIPPDPKQAQQHKEGERFGHGGPGFH
jgi:hypothetical protein